MGGIDSAKEKIFSNDIEDVEYAVLGARCRGLISKDKRANRIYDALCAGYAFRAKVPSLVPSAV
jgi:hypothetical protein